MCTLLRRPLALALLLLASAAVADRASAQAGVPTADAQAYVGDWVLNVDTDQGPFVMNVAIADAAGTLAANITSDIGDSKVEKISKTGENLLLEYEASMQGQTFPIAITLKPDGAGLKADLDFAAGMFLATGTATRK